MSGSFGRIDRDLVIGGAFRGLRRNAGALLVWIAYVAHADRDGVAFVGEERIARWCGITLETVRKARRRLEEMGLLIDTGEVRGRCKVYRIPQPALGGEGVRLPKAGAADPPTPVVRPPNVGASNPPTLVGANRVEQRGTEGEQAPTPFEPGSEAEAGYLRLTGASGEGAAS